MHPYPLVNSNGRYVAHVCTADAVTIPAHVGSVRGSRVGPHPN